MELKKEKFGNDFQRTLSSAAAEVERFLAGIEEIPDTRLDAALGLFRILVIHRDNFQVCKVLKTEIYLKFCLQEYFPSTNEEFVQNTNNLLKNFSVH